MIEFIAGIIVLLSQDLCISVTNYWPYKLYYNDNQPVQVEFYEIANYYFDVQKTQELLDGGEVYWKAVPFGGQANEEPEITAAGYRLDPNKDQFRIAAASKYFINQRFLFNGWDLWIVDTFGRESYRENKVIWHNSYERFVIPVDIFTWIPLHYLECNWEIKNYGER